MSIEILENVSGYIDPADFSTLTTVVKGTTRDDLPADFAALLVAKGFARELPAAKAETAPKKAPKTKDDGLEDLGP